MSQLLELFGRGLEHDVADVLDRYYWAPQTKTMQELKAICTQHPNWPDINLQLGLAYLRAMHVQEAIAYLSQSCRYKPDYLSARLALAAAHVEAGQLDKAVDHLKLANQTHAGEAPILFALGFCLEKMRNPQDACAYYRDAIARDGNFRAARERLAAAAVLLGNDAEAIQQYQALRQGFPHESWIRSALAHLHFRAGQFSNSVEEFEGAIAMEPENWALQDDEVEALASEGLLREAIERLHTLIEQQGPFADLHVRLADLYSRCGDDDAAMKHYNIAMELAPTYLEAHAKAGSQHLASGRWEEAAEAFHQAAEINDQALSSYVGLGVAQLAGGDRTAAMNSFELAAAIEPNSTLLLAEVARVQLRAAVADAFSKSFEAGKDVPTAEIELDNDQLLARQVQRHGEFVQQHPSHADLRCRYGVLLRAEGRLGEALEQFAKAVEINPAYVQAIIKLGLTQQELGMIPEAIETFRKALDIKPQYVDLHYRLGLLYTDRRQFEEAVAHMEKAAAGSPDNQQIRAGLALALQNLGLMDRAAAEWRSLWRLHATPTQK